MLILIKLMTRKISSEKYKISLDSLNIQQIQVIRHLLYAKISYLTDSQSIPVFKLTLMNFSMR